MGNLNTSHFIIIIKRGLQCKAESVFPNTLAWKQQEQNKKKKARKEESIYKKVQRERKKGGNNSSGLTLPGVLPEAVYELPN